MYVPVARKFVILDWNLLPCNLLSLAKTLPSGITQEKMYLCPIDSSSKKKWPSNIYSTWSIFSCPEPLNKVFIPSPFFTQLSMLQPDIGKSVLLICKTTCLFFTFHLGPEDGSMYFDKCTSFLYMSTSQQSSVFQSMPSPFHN